LKKSGPPRGFKACSEAANCFRYFSQEAGFSIERACKVLQLSTGGFYYKTVKNDLPVIDMLNELAEEHPTRGFDWYYGNLRNRGLPWNRKRVLRIYRSMDLKLRRKRKRRILKRPKQPLIEAWTLNETWSGRRAVWILSVMLLVPADGCEH